jgi:ABC-type dipeptide/oligopeptide/nickel transport system permease subunit
VNDTDGPAGSTGPDGPAGSTGPGQRELPVRTMSRRRLVLRRFLRHRGALLGLLLFTGTVLLAFTSIGFLGLPGWWGQPYQASGVVENGGRMTLHPFPSADLMPSFLDGDGMFVDPSTIRVGAHPFGQDDVGRDYFATTMRGAQISLTIALAVGAVSTLLGTAVGALAGYFRGWVEGTLMQVTDLFLAVPLLVVASVIGRVNDGGPLILALLLGLLTWMSMARLVRGEFLSLREKEFVEAARALGASSGRIIFRHILPNATGTIVVNATLTVALAILLETSVSYLGFGVQPPDTSLGKLISDNQNACLVRPWLFWWPGMFIVAIALSVNFIGDGLRDAFDPQQNRVRA